LTTVPVHGPKIRTVRAPCSTPLLAAHTQGHREVVALLERR
jgi:hypothetical protein